MHRHRWAAAALTLSLGAAVLTGCSGDESAKPDGSSPRDKDTRAALEKQAQRVRLEMQPQLAQPGTAPAASAKALSTMLASVKPARPGARVLLQQRQPGGTWEDVTTSPTDKRGRVVFAAPYAVDGEAAVYRVRAVEGRRFTAATSRALDTDRWGDPDFDEEFAGSALPQGWSHRLQGYAPDSNRACSKADPAATDVNGGVADLTVASDPGRAGQKCRTEDGRFDYRINGHISTDGRHAFRYGWFAARIKFQPARGQHGAFWMQPQSPTATVGSPSDTGAEIDVIEWFGEDQPQGGLTSFVYYRPDEEGRKAGGFIRRPERFGEDWADRYHVFSVQWTPKEYVFRIDGQETFRTSKGVSGQEQYLILSLLSSDYELPFIKDAALPQTMSVDWVRFWSL
jgi:beta-glucanase (GH16 family)